MFENGLGWRPELEQQHATALAAMSRPMVCATSGPLKHQSIDPRSEIPCNDQRQRNSCEGNARAKSSEYCNWVETGRWVKLSARNAYLTSRMVDGTNNEPDSGASISGGVLASKQYGECLESTFPYWTDQEQFSGNIPDVALTEAATHRLRSSTPLRSADESVVFIDMGFGAELFGIWWSQGLANFRGEFLDIADDYGGIVGGHALAILGFLMRGGEPWLIMFNSHGTHWGKNGTAVVSMRLFDRWLLRSPFGAIGVSDLPDFGGGPRELKSWTGLLG